jgi:hypothetical protein
MAAYAAATSTTASWETIRDAATSGRDNKPAKTTTSAYRDLLERLRILEELPAWLPSRNYLSRLASSAKHHLADPALAASLLGVGVGQLIKDGSLLGHLFESLLTQSLRVYAQSAEARVYHFRTRGGDREVDAVVQRDDGRIVAIEFKLGRSIDESDVKHLKWLEQQAGDEVLDTAVLYTGQHAYRRKDGVAVIPAALLGP